MSEILKVQCDPTQVVEVPFGEHDTLVLHVDQHISDEVVLRLRKQLTAGLAERMLVLGQGLSLSILRRE